MIGRIRGVILEKKPPLVLLEAYGIGYEIYVPVTCFHELPNVGYEAILFTHFVVREDTQLLYGFNNKQERMIFRELIKTNGIGPKLALMILSGMSFLLLVKAIENKDPSALIKLPGVGKKTAERLIIEMKDRIKSVYSYQCNSMTNLVLKVSATKLINDAEQEAVAALVALGYKPLEANWMVSKIATSSTNSEAIIREALRTTL